jgi:hypothetical protein
MKLDSVGEIIASRKFWLLRQDVKTELVVVMGKPEAFQHGADYYCPYQILGFGRETVMAIAGIDAFQAIQLALGTIRVELEVIGRDSGGQILWEGDEAGYLGFAELRWDRK